MKTILKTFTIFILITLFSSCNWLFPKCEGYYLYEINDYKKIEFNYIEDTVNGIVSDIDSDYFLVKYDELITDVKPSLDEIGITEQCSYMEYKVIDSIKIFDIYSNNDYNSNFYSNSNLNKLFTNLYNGDYTIYEKLLKNNLSPGPSLFLNQAPSEIDTFIFYIHIELTDNRVFDLESKPIIITP